MRDLCECVRVGVCPGVRVGMKRGNLCGCVREGVCPGVRVRLRWVEWKRRHQFP